MLYWFLIMFFFSVSSLLRFIMNEKWDTNSSENWHPIWNVNDTKHHLYSDINITYVNYYLHQPQVAAIFIISYFLIFFLCMMGNTVVCFIVMRNKHMHTVTNLFILNLAISDLLVGIFCMPITLLDNIIAGMSAFVQFEDNMKYLSHISAAIGRAVHSFIYLQIFMEFQELIQAPALIGSAF